MRISVRGNSPLESDRGLGHGPSNTDCVSRHPLRGTGSLLLLPPELISAQIFSAKALGFSVQKFVFIFIYLAYMMWFSILWFFLSINHSLSSRAKDSPKVSVWFTLVVLNFWPKNTQIGIGVPSFFNRIIRLLLSWWKCCLHLTDTYGMSWHCKMSKHPCPCGLISWQRRQCLRWIYCSVRSQ